MREKKTLNKPKKSLRNILSFWFLFFSIIPLIFITGYSLSQFEYAIDQELFKRLQGNAREIGVVFDELEDYLLRYGRLHATDPSLVFNLNTASIPKARRLVSDWMKNYAVSRISLFDKDGRLIVALYKSSEGMIKSQTNLESGDVFLSEELLKSFGDETQVKFRDVRPNHGMELIVYSKVVANKGRLVGFVEEIINIDEAYLSSLKNRLNLELTLLNEEFTPVASTLEDFTFLPSRYFSEKVEENVRMFFQADTKKKAYGFLVSPIKSSQKRIYLGLAASKDEVGQVLSGIQNALITVVAVIIILMVLTLIAATNMIVRPINDLVEAAQKIESGRFGTQIPVQSETELGILANTFNKMSSSVAEAQDQLNEKIEELQSTQSKLVHSAKMVGLGQLVAGVAHELNNPIGFIYSNMTHLKDYSEKLQRLVETAEKDPKKIDKVKKEIEYDYIMEDLPKLIKSCEEGARRTRDIVLGLRNFSRLEGQGLQEVNLKENIQNTLNLLVGELKTRIQVHVEFGEVPAVKCYANQINQVLMNILSNAAQAIDGEGEIWIRANKENEFVVIEIQDSGKGISKEEIEHIFDPFYTTKPVGEGTGLGLSISYGIVQKHGGDIKVESSAKKGTQFRIFLPISGPQEAEA